MAEKERSMFSFLERIRGKGEEREEAKSDPLKSTRIDWTPDGTETPAEEGIGSRIYRTTHVIGEVSKKEAKPHGLGNGDGNGNGKKKGLGTGIPRDLDFSKVEANDKAVIPTLPEGALSIAAGASAEENRIYIFHWPTMVYIGYDVKGSEPHYREYLILLYKPNMVHGFSTKLTIDAPAKNEVEVLR